MRRGAPLTEDGCEFEPPLWRRRQAPGHLWSFQSVRFFVARVKIELNVDAPGADHRLSPLRL